MNNIQNLDCASLGSSHALSNAIPNKVAMLSVQLYHPVSSEVDKPNQSVITVFIENLNGLMSDDIERRRGNGEVLPDCRIDRCWAGLGVNGSQAAYTVVLPLDLGAYESLTHLPVEFSELDTMITKAWSKALQVGVSMAGDLVQVGQYAQVQLQA